MDDPRFLLMSAFIAPKPLTFKHSRSKTTFVLFERRYALGLGSDMNLVDEAEAEERIGEERGFGEAFFFHIFVKSNR